MTPQEQKMLDDLMARVDSTRLDDKDPEAAQRIEEWSRRNPDAAYILAQTVLVQSYALEQAKAQIQSLQQQLAQHPALPQQPQKQGSFLGNLFGHKDEPRPQQPAPGYAQPQQQGYAQVPQYAAAAAVWTAGRISTARLWRAGRRAGRAFCALPRRRPQAWLQVRWRLRALSR